MTVFRKVLPVVFSVVVIAGAVAYANLGSDQAEKVPRMQADVTAASENAADTIRPWIRKDTSALITDILKQHRDLFQNVLDSANQFEVQIIYTRIDRDSRQVPSFTEYSWRVNDGVYFNPASLVKFPVMLLALDKINRLQVPRLNKYSRMETDSAWECQTPVVQDTAAPGITPSIAHYCKKIMLTSDNDGYNRLYEFLGQKYINQKLWRMGYTKSLIIQRFDHCGYDENRYTNPVKMYSENNKLIYFQPMVVNPEKYMNPLGVVKKGSACFVGNQLVKVPKDFTYSNNLPLQDLHDMFLSFLFPDQAPPQKRFRLTGDDYRMLLRYMSIYVRESEYADFPDFKIFPDNLKKYFLWGGAPQSIHDKNIRSVNIPGQSFGYLSDCAYIADFKNNVEFILLAVIYTNQSGIFNMPSYYRYYDLGFPFLRNLGRTFYAYELSRKRKIKPDLSPLKGYIESNSSINP